MKKLLVAIWIVIASLTLGYNWYDYPDAFPKFSQNFAVWLIDDVFHASNQEEVADIELLFVLAVSAVIVSAATFLALYAWRKLRK